MARKSRDFDAELQALMQRAKKVKTQKTNQLGELVQLTGADAISFEPLAGLLLAGVELFKKQPEAVARWTERGRAFFQDGAKRGKKQGAVDAAAGPAGHNGASPAPGRAAQ